MSTPSPDPITATGYLAHGIDDHELADAGGAVQFFTAWMDRAAKAKPYQEAQYLWRQGDLFHTLD